MTTTTIRYTLTRELVALFRSDTRLMSARIEPGWPGTENLLPVSIWVDEIDGDYDYPFEMAGRKIRDDHFKIPFLVRVVGEATLDATHDRLGDVIASIDDILADDPTVGGFDGLMFGLVGNVRSTLGMTPDGPVGWGQVTVSSFARYL